MKSWRLLFSFAVAIQRKDSVSNFSSLQYEKFPTPKNVVICYKSNVNLCNSCLFCEFGFSEVFSFESLPTPTTPCLHSTSLTFAFAFCLGYIFRLNEIRQKVHSEEINLSSHPHPRDIFCLNKHHLIKNHAVAHRFGTYSSASLALSRGTRQEHLRGD